jgi:two-component system NarL family response regulator
VAGDVIKHLIGHPSTAEVSPADKLTTREREVLQLIAEGHTTRQIAERLNISVKTVEARRRNLMHKLDLHSVAALTKFAIREGLSTADKP